MAKDQGVRMIPTITISMADIKGLAFNKNKHLPFLLLELTTSIYLKVSVYPLTKFTVFFKKLCYGLKSEQKETIILRSIYSALTLSV